MVSNEEVVAVVQQLKSLTDDEKGRIIPNIPNLTEEQKQQILKLGDWSKDNMQAIRKKYESGLHDALVNYQQEMVNIYNTTKMPETSRLYELNKLQKKLEKVHKVLVES